MSTGVGHDCQAHCDAVRLSCEGRSSADMHANAKVSGFETSAIWADWNRC